MNRDQAMRKVLACLRLSKSSNPHEAAAALRQARALMERFGLNETDAAAAEIAAADAPTRSRGAMVPNSVLFLAKIIADGYRCQVLIDCLRGAGGRGSTRVQFHGHRSDAEVSAYAFTVLRRQMDADKSRRLQFEERRRRRKFTPSRRMRLGELFAMGWVGAVRDMFPRAEVDDAHALAIRTAIARQNPVETELRPQAGRRKSRTDLEMQLAGYYAGANAQLNRGLSGEARGTGSLHGPLALEHSA